MPQQATGFTGPGSWSNRDCQTDEDWKSHGLYNNSSCSKVTDQVLRFQEKQTRFSNTNQTETEAMSNHRMTAEVLAKINLSENRTAIKEALAKMMNREPSGLEIQLVEAGYLMGATSLAADMMEAQSFLDIANN